VRIGVVIPAYNAARWIGEALTSVLRQKHRDWVLVVVDDGSTDSTDEVVRGFGDERIGLIRQANAGVSAARNRGKQHLLETSLSREAGEGRGGGGGNALLFLDADDWLASDALSRLSAALDAAPHAVAASGAYAFVDTGTVRSPPSGYILRRLLVQNLFANGGHLLVRAEAVHAAGGFRPDISYGEDWEYWVRIALQGCFIAAEGRAPVLFVRRHADGAYQRLAADPSAFLPCMDAIFGNPDLIARFGPDGLAAVRQRTEAENAWVIGRELIRHGHQLDGTAWLRRSVAAHPSTKRAIMLAAAHALALLPEMLQGPFRAYPQSLDQALPSGSAGPRELRLQCPHQPLWQEDDEHHQQRAVDDVVPAHSASAEANPKHFGEQNGDERSNRRPEQDVDPAYHGSEHHL
jgi:hypothetical protein